MSSSSIPERRGGLIFSPLHAAEVEEKNEVSRNNVEESQLLRNALAANDHYQQAILAKMKEIDRLLDLTDESLATFAQVQARQQDAKQVTRFQVADATTVALHRAVPFFSDESGATPELNMDARRMVAEHAHLFQLQAEVTWDKALDDALGTLVLKQVREILREEDGEAVNSYTRENLLARFHHVESDLNWYLIAVELHQLVASGYAYKQQQRSAMDCFLHWRNFLDPRINHTKWATEETEHLNELAKQYKFRQWTRVARELGTNRTALQCLEQYESVHSHSVGTGVWTQAAEQALVQAVLEYGKDVCAIEFKYETGHTIKEIQSKIVKMRTLEQKKGKFTRAERGMLLLAVQCFGNSDWDRIVKMFFPHRSAKQLRGCYTNLVTEKKKKKIKKPAQPFTAEEDDAIIRGVKEVQTMERSRRSQWNEIAKAYVPNRRPSEIRARYQTHLEQWVVHCKCGINAINYDDGKGMIICDKCEQWSHMQCISVPTSTKKRKRAPRGKFICHTCTEQSLPRKNKKKKKM